MGAAIAGLPNELLSDILRRCTEDRSSIIRVSRIWHDNTTRWVPICRKHVPSLFEENDDDYCLSLLKTVDPPLLTSWICSRYITDCERFKHHRCLEYLTTLSLTYWKFSNVSHDDRCTIHCLLSAAISNGWNDQAKHLLNNAIALPRELYSAESLNEARGAAINMAFENKNYEAVQWLKAGAIINSDQGRKVLRFAAAQRHDALLEETMSDMRFSLRQIEFRNDELRDAAYHEFVLSSVAEEGRLDLVLRFMPGNPGKELLHEVLCAASRGGHEHVMEVLMQLLRNFYIPRRTIPKIYSLDSHHQALGNAAQSGQLGATNMLIHEIEYLFPSYKVLIISSTLEHSFYSDNWAIIELFMSETKKASRDTRIIAYQRSMLALAQRASRNEHDVLLRRLSDELGYICLESQFSSFWSALQRAVSNDQTLATQTLLDLSRPFPADKRKEAVRSALGLAARNGKFRAMALLMATELLSDESCNRAIQEAVRHSFSHKAVAFIQSSEHILSPDQQVLALKYALRDCASRECHNGIRLLLRKTKHLGIMSQLSGLEAVLHASSPSAAFIKDRIARLLPINASALEDLFHRVARGAYYNVLEIISCSPIIPPPVLAHAYEVFLGSASISIPKTVLERSIRHAASVSNVAEVLMPQKVALFSSMMLAAVATSDLSLVDFAISHEPKTTAESKAKIYIKARNSIRTGDTQISALIQQRLDLALHDLSQATIKGRPPKNIANYRANELRPIGQPSSHGYVLADVPWSTGSRTITTDGYVLFNDHGLPFRLCKIFQGQLVSTNSAQEETLPYPYGNSSTTMPQGASVSIEGLVRSSTTVYFLIAVEQHGRTVRLCTSGGKMPHLQVPESRRNSEMEVHRRALHGVRVKVKSGKHPYTARSLNSEDQSTVSFKFWQRL